MSPDVSEGRMFQIRGAANAKATRKGWGVWGRVELGEK